MICWAVFGSDFCRRMSLIGIVPGPIDFSMRSSESESASARDKTRLRKESDQLKKTLRECEDWEREVLLPLAQQRIELDLDDGVKVNYLKLGAALAPIAGLEAKEED